MVVYIMLAVSLAPPPFPCSFYFLLPSPPRCCYPVNLCSPLPSEHPKSPTKTDAPEKIKDVEEDEKEDKKKSLMTEEKAETGRVNFSVLLTYCRAATWYLAVCVVLFNVLQTAVGVGTNFWLAEWSTAAGAGNFLGENATVAPVTACDTTGSPV